MPLNAVALNCTLTPSPAASSTELLARQVLDALAQHDVEGTIVRVVDRDVRPGVELDMGNGDQWPQIRGLIMASDILVLATPTWMGQQSSVAQRVFERLDAELSQTDDRGRLQTNGKVAVAVIVGNEDGAHHITGVTLQCLNDVGFTIPAGGAVYWNGEAMHTTDYKDLEETPEKVATTTKTLAANAAHLASLLKSNAYPAA
ncbi:MAG: NAD(P)H-dependent oxidoreductase [Lapillicoccus sp.]